jgi:copper homeostasis protein (lipoprotein)
MLSTIPRVRVFSSVLICLAMFAATANVSAESMSVTAHEAHHGKKSIDWPGIYNGFLPCDNCAGVKTSLALNKNGSYVLITQFVGKSPRDYVEKGKYVWDEKSNTIVLTSRKGDAVHRYFVGEDDMITLDEKGDRYTGKLADRYILRKTDVTSGGPIEQHSGH